MDAQAPDARPLEVPDRDSGLLDSGLVDAGSFDGSLSEAGFVDAEQHDGGLSDSGASAFRLDVEQWRTATWDALTAARVEAVDSTGAPTGMQIPVVEGSVGEFLVSPSCERADGTLPTDTTAWLQGQPCITIVFNLNALPPENPDGLNDWIHAGSLVRGVSLVGDELASPRTLAIDDFNVADVTAEGVFEQPDDAYGPEDKEIPANQKPSIDEIKRLLLESLLPG